MITFDCFINTYLNGDHEYKNIVGAIKCLSPILNVIQIEDNDEYIEVLKCFHEHLCGCHFNEYFAKEQVNSMYHTKMNGELCKGEIYDIVYAKHIHNLYIKNIIKEVTCWDVYVALNAQYHDHIKEYHQWFDKMTDKDINNKIISSAITFWFKDEDAGNGKVWNYFKNIG